MKLSAKQKSFIDSLVPEDLSEETLPEVHEEIYDRCLDEMVVNLDDGPDPESADQIYSNLVWDYLREKI